MRIHELATLVSDQVDDIGDLCAMLEISIEDIIERFPDFMLDHQSKFGFPETIDGMYAEEVDDDDELAEEIEDIYA